MKDRIWTPFYAIWNCAAGGNGWVRSAANNICTFDNRKEAENFRNSQLSHPSAVKAFIPYLGCPDECPKKMKDIEELTSYWRYHHPKEKNGS